MSVMGRPKGAASAISAQQQKQLAKIISDGNYIEPACDALGVNRSTFYYWMDEGNKANSVEPYKTFSDTIKKAFAQAEISAVKKIKSGGKGWQSSAWWLERYQLIRERWAIPKEDHKDTSSASDKALEIMEKAVEVMKANR